MGQRTRILTEILGFDGWKVKAHYFEAENGQQVLPVRGYSPLRTSRLVLVLERQWRSRCSQCGRPCRRKHETLDTRRWDDLPWAEHPVVLEFTPIRVKCRHCGKNPIEMLAWADPYQRQTRRLQHRLAVESASMPVLHVAAIHRLSWATVRRAEVNAIERWEKTRPVPELRHVGVDEKWLGRRNQLEHDFVTIVSNLETGEPLWIGAGRTEETFRSWLKTLGDAQKAAIRVFAMDMWQPFWNAVNTTPGLAHAAIVHDPFHLMKRVGQCIDELRRQIFFRDGPEMRALGRGHRWLLLRAWERCSDEEQRELRTLLAMNKTLARAYQIKEEMREVLRAPTRNALEQGLNRILRRTARRSLKPLRSLHDALDWRYNEIVALGEHRPATGRIEALNNNWETLVRRARGYRDHNYLLRKLRFMTANPIRSRDGLGRFVALADYAALAA